MKYDILIVGSGLFGATFARLATDAGYRCLVIDKRNHAGGNVYCENIDGINVHVYGAHIFHTSESEIWSFVNRFVHFNRYTNSPIALAPNGKIFNLPFNLNTFYQMWGVKTPSEADAILNNQKKEGLEFLKSKGKNEPTNLEEQALCLIGRDIYEQLIKEYTEKQWGRPCSELPPFIINRLPVRLIYDNNYFNDCYQGIPIGGYNKLITEMLQGIEVRLNEDFFANRNTWSNIANKIVFTGKIDEFFEYKYGKLEYRTVNFTTKILDTPNFQGNAVVNYTSKEFPFTRIIEHKHFECFGEDIYKLPRTVISEEYSTEWQDGLEPFYPINDEKNTERLRLYNILAQNENNIIFGGRLAEYKYYDMAPVIKSAIEKFKNFHSRKNKTDKNSN